MTNLDTDTVEVLKEVMEGDFALLLDTFFEDSSQRLLDLKEILDQQDAEAFRRCAHSFKGSAGNMGALALTQLCQQAEEMGLSQDLVDAEDLIVKITSEYQSVKVLLENYR